MLLFLICKEDNFGVIYNNDFTFLIKAPENLNGSYEIPSTVKYIGSSTKLSDSPFFGCKSLITSITFAMFSQCISICSFCFSESNLESVDMQYCTNLLALNNSLFRKCPKLKTVNFPPKITYIGSGCFNYDSALSRIVLPDSVEIIEDNTAQDSGVFKGTIDVIEISRNSNLTKIGAESFAESRIKTIFIPKHVKHMMGQTFFGCKFESIQIDPDNPYFKTDSISIFTGENNNSLVYVSSAFNQDYVVPSFVLNLKIACFRKCSVRSISFHENILAIDALAFAYTPITEITIPNNIKVLGTSLFQGCTKLRTINLPNDYTKIGIACFVDCKSLQSLYISDQLDYIGEGAFTGCNSTMIFYSSGNSKLEISGNILLSDERKNMLQYIGDDENAVVNAPPELTSIGGSCFVNKKLKTITFNGDQLTKIGKRAFDSSTITSSSLPSSLTTLGQECFRSCSKLTTVVFNGNLITEIPDYCFYQCNKLSNIQLPSSIRSIGTFAFYSCFAIGDISLNNLINVSEQAFSNSGLTVFNIQNTMNRIDFSCFSNCLSLEEVTISCPIIPLECFIGCQNLRRLNLNEGIKTIKSKAFYQCSSIESFTIPASLTDIESFAFRGCTNLNRVSLSLGSNLITILGGCFVECVNLFSITVSKDDTKFKFSNGALTDYAETKIYTFIPCSSIQTFVVPPNTVSIQSYAFMSCKNLIRIIFSGSSIKTIGYQSFTDCSSLSFLFLGTSVQLSEIQDMAFDGCPLLRRCGAISCPTSAAQIFKSKFDIPNHSFSTNCPNGYITCKSKPNAFSFSISLTMPMILM